jgi:hypothetical protein
MPEVRRWELVYIEEAIGERTGSPSNGAALRAFRKRRCGNNTEIWVDKGKERS